ncbi:MAG TPA: hypothetical protein VHM70_11780 [Polyangiaceae bacterium]|jgi:hypothetical protein|nr:hypothetical protein [Polyangiaceae bacterium]
MRHLRRDEQFWKEVCAEYRRGGQTRPALAAKYDVNESTLNYHLSKAKSARAPMFLPVQVASGPAQTAGVEVVLRNGAVVRVEVGADVEYVARLVRALQG